MLVSGSSLEADGLKIDRSTAPWGGALHIEGHSTTVVANSDISACSAEYGGAISASDIIRLDVSNSSFTGCTAWVQGGAIKSVAAEASFTQINLTDCLVDAPSTEVCLVLNKYAPKHPCQCRHLPPPLPPRES